MATFLFITNKYSALNKTSCSFYRNTFLSNSNIFDVGMQKLIKCRKATGPPILFNNIITHIIVKMVKYKKHREAKERVDVMIKDYLFIFIHEVR